MAIFACVRGLNAYIRNSALISTYLPLSAGFLLLLACACYSREAKKDFVPFDFLKAGVRNDDLPNLFWTITGSKVGGDTLKSCGSVALIEFKRAGISEGSGFSFQFDEKVVTRHAVIERSQAFELCDELRLPDGYGYNKYEGATFEIKRRAWTNLVGMELSNGTRFLRVYFDNEFSHCFYVSCTGEYGGTWALAPAITRRIKTLVDRFRVHSDNKGSGKVGPSLPGTEKESEK